VSSSKSRAPKAYRTLITLGNPRVKVRLRLMDFVVGLPIRKKNNAIWVIVDRLTKMTHCTAIRNMWTLDQLARAYLEEIV